jgi:hypothetical protein
MHSLLKRLLLAAAVAGGLSAVSPKGEAASPTGRLVVEGTEFVLRLDDGRVLRGDALIGAAFVIRHRGQATKILIESAERQATARGEVVLYRFTLRDPIGGTVTEICDPDARGRRTGFPVSDGEGGFALTCTSGAEGKCILLGYRPWESDGDVPMRDLHRACIHMIRADYGGDNRPTTRDGTTIDIYDRFGVQASEAMPGMAFEAAWGASGAVCVARPRIAQNITLQELGLRYPRLAGRLGPETCSEPAMQGQPKALLFNRSYP